jgi:predicted aspartyl protease
MQHATRIKHDNQRMGLTTVELTLSKIGSKRKKITDQFLVDSGASLTVLPKAMWQTLKLRPVDSVTIRLADGRVEQRQIGFAMATFGNKTVPTQVILGEADDSKLIGVLTLEEMGLVLNPLKRTLEVAELRM